MAIVLLFLLFNSVSSLNFGAVSDILEHIDFNRIDLLSFDTFILDSGIEDGSVEMLTDLSTKKTDIKIIQEDELCTGGHS